MDKNNKYTIIILASTEKEALKKTVKLLLENCNNVDIAEIIIFLKSENCPSCEIAKELESDENNPVKIRCCVQNTPGLHYTVFESPKLVHSSHFLIIGSDLEMDPLAAPKLIEISKEHPKAIVCASKFMKDSHRKNYGLIHHLGNRAVNFTLEKLLHINGTELLITFQVYPTDLFFKMNFTDPKLTFYQFTIRPLRKGTEYIEIPTNYIRRTEGESNYDLKRYIDLGVNFLRAGFVERRLMKEENK